MIEHVEKREIAAHEVAAYLRKHTEFLVAHPELAILLKLPREQGASTSLASYQLDVLRDKNRNLHRKLQELIEIANENEQLMARVHAFTCGLMRAVSAEETLSRAAAILLEDFRADLIRIVLHTQVSDLKSDWLLVVDAHDVSMLPFAEMIEKSETLCGRLREDKLNTVFGNAAEGVKSAAMAPIARRGLLSVGSADANRFYPGMGTVFLRLIAESLDAALARFD